MDNELPPPFLSSHILISTPHFPVQAYQTLMVEQEVKRQQLVAEGRIIDKAQGVKMCGYMCGGGGEVPHVGHVFPACCIIFPVPI